MIQNLQSNGFEIFYLLGQLEMGVIKKSNVFLIIYSIFVALSISGNVGIAGIKLSIIFSNIIFACLIIVSGRYSFKKKYGIYYLYLFIIVISILYTLMIDVLNGNGERALYRAFSEIYIGVFALVNLLFFSELSIQEIERIFLRSNKLMLFTNIVILFFAFTPPLKHIVFDMSQYGGRLKAFTDQTNGYALLLIFNISIAIYCFLKKRDLFSVSALVIAIVLGIMTQSRGLVLGAFSAIFITYFIVSFVKKTERKKILITTALVLPLLLSFSQLSTQIASFLASGFGVELSRFNVNSDTNYSGSIDVVDFSERTDLLKAGLETVAEHPFGIGFVDHHLEIYKITGIPFISHNFFVETILSYGVIFGLLWLLIFPYTAYVLIKKLNSTQSVNEQQLFVLFSLVLFQLMAFFMTHASGTIYIWFFIALTIGFAKNSSNKKLLIKQANK